MVILGGMHADATHVVAQYVAMSISPTNVESTSVVYRCYSWVVDMRRNDGDAGRVTCLSGVFARDGAYYPFHDHIDDGSLQHVDRFLADGRGGYYHQRGFVWTSHGDYRESMSWTHYRRILLRRIRRAPTGPGPTGIGRLPEDPFGKNVSRWPVLMHPRLVKTGLY